MGPSLTPGGAATLLG